VNGFVPVDWFRHTQTVLLTGCDADGSLRVAIKMAAIIGFIVADGPIAASGPGHGLMPV